MLWKSKMTPGEAQDELEESLLWDRNGTNRDFYLL